MENATHPFAHHAARNTSLWFLRPSSWWTPETKPYLLALLVVYPVVCSLLRFRRLKQIQRPFIGRKLNSMTAAEANTIMKQVARFEFPALYEMGYQLALFRTYGIPTISRLLSATTQIASAGTVGRRYADTAAIMAEIYNNPPTTDRHQEAYARLNVLHSSYIQKGLISNDDMLYTLSLFMNHALGVIDRYEWRCPSNVEKCAWGVIHRQMARNLCIDLNNLPSSKTGWKDGIHFFEELTCWAAQYEQKAMIPSLKNFEVADATRQYFLDSFPVFLQRVISPMLSVFMDERLRKAVMFDEPSIAATYFVKTFLFIRRCTIRYLALPRPEFMKRRLVPDELGPDKRVHFMYYKTFPYFVQPTVWNRWGPGSWVRRLEGLPLPGDPGMVSEGFLTKDVGPIHLQGKGHDAMEVDLQRLRKEGRRVCPFGAID